MSRYDSPRASWSSAAGRKSAIPPELGDPDLEGDARARRGLVEDEPDRPPGQEPKLAAARALGLELVREVEQRLELVRDSTQRPA